MYKLSVRAEFSAAHSLREYKGKCEALHGHNWKVEAVVAALKLDRQGLALDFHKIKKALRDVLDELDHRYLNQLLYFKKHNPTSENLAKYIFDKLLLYRLKGNGHLQAVTVWESDNCSATYSIE